MSEKYTDAVNRICLSEEMKESIIRKTTGAISKKQKSNTSLYLRRIVGLAACLAICFLSNRTLKDGVYMPTSTIEPAISAPALQDESPNDTAMDTITPKTESDDKIPDNNKVNTEKPNVSNKKVDEKNSAAANNETSGIVSDTNKTSIGENEQTVTEIPPTTAANTNAEEEQNPNTLEYGNPMNYLSNKEQLDKELGYTVKVPQYIPDEYNCESVCVIGEYIAEITYESEHDNISYRTAKGDDDISGDCNSYDNVETTEINSFSVTLKGNDDLYFNAVWTDEKDSYSVSSANGIEKETMCNIVKSVE